MVPTCCSDMSVVLLSTSDDGLLGSYTTLDQFVPPKCRSKPTWSKDPVDHLMNMCRENPKTYPQHPCRCSALVGCSWWMGLQVMVKCQGVGVYLLELQCDKVNCAYEGKEKEGNKRDAVTALVFHSQATV